MKRKLLIALLAVALLVALTACGEYDTDSDSYTDTDYDYFDYYEEEGTNYNRDESVPNEIALEVFNAFLQQITPLDNNEFWALDHDLTVRIGINVLGDWHQVHQNSNVRTIIDGSQTQMSVIHDLDMSDFNTPHVNSDMYVVMDDDAIVDYFMVIFNDGEDVTGFLPYELIEEIVIETFENSGEIHMPEINESAIQSVEIEEVSGKTVISMFFYADEVEEFVVERLTDYARLMGGIDIEVAADINAVSLLIVITTDSNGNPFIVDMDMRMTLDFPDDVTIAILELSGEQVQLRMTRAYVINAVGDDVEITWPEVATQPELTPAPDTSQTPDVSDTLPGSSDMFITVPEDQAELDELLLFLDLFELDTIVVTDEASGRQQVSLFATLATFERLEWFYDLTGIYINPMEIVLTGASFFEAYRNITDDQRMMFILIVAAGGP